MDPGPIQWVVDGFPEYFARHGSCVPFSQHQVAQQIGNRIPFGLAKIGMV